MLSSHRAQHGGHEQQNFSPSARCFSFLDIHQDVLRNEKTTIDTSGFRDSPLLNECPFQQQRRVRRANDENSLLSFGGSVDSAFSLGRPNIDGVSRSQEFSNFDAKTQKISATKKSSSASDGHHFSVDSACFAESNQTTHSSILCETRPILPGSSNAPKTNDITASALFTEFPSPNVSTSVKVSPLRPRAVAYSAGGSKEPFSFSPQPKVVKQRVASSFGKHNRGSLAVKKETLPQEELERRVEIIESSQKRNRPSVGALSSTGRSKSAKKALAKRNPPNEKIIDSQNYQLECAAYKNRKLLEMNSTLQKILLAKDKDFEGIRKDLVAKEIALKESEGANKAKDEKIVDLEGYIQNLAACIRIMETSVAPRGTKLATLTTTFKKSPLADSGHDENKRVTRSMSKR